MRIRGLALALCLLASTALAASTIDATKPETRSVMSSAVIRANFAAAAADITALQSSVASGSGNALQKSGNLADLANVATARTNLGLATIATSGSASDLSAGTLPTARMPAMTGGDCTTSAGGVSIICSVTSMTGALADGRLSANVPLLNAANPFTAAQTVTLAGTGDALRLTSQDAGALGAPHLTLFRDSASPAANDAIGGLFFDGRDSAGNQQTYVYVVPVITDATSTSEDSDLYFHVTVGGADVATLVILNSHVVFTGAATPAVATGAGDCGTSPSIAGNDNTGRVTVGSSTNGGKCTVTFALSYAHAPQCSVFDETTSNLMRPVSATGTLAITGTLVAGDKLVYTCFDYR